MVAHAGTQLARLFFTAGPMVALIACGPSQTGSTDASAGDCDPACPGGTVCTGGQCVPEGIGCSETEPCPDGFHCDLDGQCVASDDCGSSELVIERIGVNMMVLLDRSGSMDAPVGSDTRWDVAKSAIETITNQFDAQIRFGLATYPSCEVAACGAGKVVVPLADANATAINGFLAPLQGEPSSPPVSGTPTKYLCGKDGDPPQTSTGKSLFALVGESTLQDPARRNAVLLITDGAEKAECTADGAQTGPKGAMALLAQAIGVQTYVVGFSGDVDAGELEAVAVAGGTQRYYQADDAAELLTALQTIAEDSITCDFQLGSTPPDADELGVYFNDDPTAIPADPTDGWTYDETTNTISFHGAACEQIKSGAVDDIDVIFGCDGPVVD